MPRFNSHVWQATAEGISGQEKALIRCNRPIPLLGEVAERPKAAVLKVVGPPCTPGSYPATVSHHESA